MKEGTNNKDWEQRSINERIKFIVDHFFDGNATKMAKTVFVKQSTIRDIIGDRNSAPSYETMRQIVDSATLGLSPEWLLTGRGEMLKNDNKRSEGKSIALYDVDAAAGHESFDVMIEKEKVAGRFVIPTFASADWMIYVRGSSMYPKYSSGDIIACKVINESRFIQWNKVHVVATREQGLLIKRLMPSEDETCITAVSDNEKYPPFDIPKDEIYGIAIVLGAVKLE